jgi:hypothetical protein
MYKFVNTLTDSGPWIDHFKKQAEKTSHWKSKPENTVIILPDTIKNTGVYDATKLQTVTPIEQVSKQAEATLIKEVKEENSTVGQDKKKRSVRKSKNKKPAKSVKRKVGAITKHTKDIFTEEYKKRSKKN